MSALHEYAYERRREEQEDLGECRLLGAENRISKCRKPRKLSCRHEVKVGEPIYTTVYILDGEFQCDTKCWNCMNAEFGPTQEEVDAWAKEQRDEEQAQAEWERRTETRDLI